jgi:hypothetical protein
VEVSLHLAMVQRHGWQDGAISHITLDH